MSLYLLERKPDLWKLGNLVHTYNPRAQEMEAELGIQSYPGLCVQIQDQPEVLELGVGKEERECL